MEQEDSHQHYLNFRKLRNTATIADNNKGNQDHEDFEDYQKQDSSNNDQSNSNNNDKTVSFCTNVGTDQIVYQSVNQAASKLFYFNIIVIGEEGCGKSSIVEELLKINHTVGDDFKLNVRSNEFKLESKKYSFREGSVRCNFCITETINYSTQMDRAMSISRIKKFIQDELEFYAEKLTDSDRFRPSIYDNRVHLCLFVISSVSGHLKLLDIELLKQISNLVNVILVIGKADILTEEEYTQLSTKVFEQVTENDIRLFTPSVEGLEEDAENSEGNRKNSQFIKNYPLRVITTTRKSKHVSQSNSSSPSEIDSLNSIGTGGHKITNTEEATDKIILEEKNVTFRNGSKQSSECTTRREDEMATISIVKNKTSSLVDNKIRSDPENTIKPTSQVISQPISKYIDNLFVGNTDKSPNGVISEKTIGNINEPISKVVSNKIAGNSGVDKSNLLSEAISGSVEGTNKSSEENKKVLSDRSQQNDNSSNGITTRCHTRRLAYAEIDIYNPTYSDLKLLEEIVIKKNMYDLIDSTDRIFDKHYHQMIVDGLTVKKLDVKIKLLNFATEKSVYLTASQEQSINYEKEINKVTEHFEKQITSLDNTIKYLKAKIKT